MLKTIFKPLTYQIIGAIAAGALLPCAFAPLNIYPLAFLSCAALLWLWLKATPKLALLFGWLFGLGMFGVGTSWIYISIHRYGNANSFGAFCLTALFVMTLALFPALLGYLYTKLLPREDFKKILLGFPLFWVIFEWLRTILFTGFPWLLLGYSQLSTPLRHLAPIFGVYGVSFAVAFSSAALVAIIKRRHIMATLIITILLWIGCIFLGQNHWVTKNNTQPISVTLIQGNVPQSLKWQEDKLMPILNRYLKLTQKHLTSQIIVWPEAAIPTFARNVPNYLATLQKLSQQNNVAIITGIPYQKNRIFYNAIWAANKKPQVYFKRHLVPFGEYTPFIESIFAPLVNYLNLPMSDFSKGAEDQPPLKALDYTLQPSLCYEVAYPNLFLQHAAKVDFLVTISDDSWFGKSWASAQQLQMAQMRSLEVGRYQLVSTNSGITAIIDQNGKLTAKAPEYQVYSLTATANIYTGTTAWVKFGHFLWLWLIFVASILLVSMEWLRDRAFSPK